MIFFKIPAEPWHSCVRIEAFGMSATVSWCQELVDHFNCTGDGSGLMLLSRNHHTEQLIFSLEDLEICIPGLEVNTVYDLSFYANRFGDLRRISYKRFRTNFYRKFIFLSIKRI